MSLAHWSGRWGPGTRALSELAPRPVSRFTCLQIGQGWFPEFAGGLENVFYNLVKYLPKTGVDVRGIVMGSPNVVRASEGTVSAFASRETARSIRLWLARRAVCDALATGRVDLAASHFALFTVPALDILKNRPLVVHFHGPWAGEARAEGSGGIQARAKAAIEQFVYRRAYRLIVLSQSFGDILHRCYGVPESNIAIIPGGVDCSRFAIEVTRAAARDHLRWAKDRPIVLSVRRLVRRMGLTELIESMREVRRRLPDVQLYIAGRGKEAGNLERQITELGLTDTVRLLGFVPYAALPLAYRAADLTVVPSMALEGFGLITIESMAAGTPVLVTPIGGLPEAVRGLSADLILPGCRATDIAAGISAALTGASPVPSAERCQSYARSNFDWPLIAARVRDVYATALR
jgi:glycosyltransferase involved in cell wall biosynthesis